MSFHRFCYAAVITVALLAWALAIGGFVCFSLALMRVVRYSRHIIEEYRTL